jgi:hypothetical protein
MLTNLRKSLSRKLAKHGFGIGKLNRHAYDDYFVFETSSNTAVLGTPHGYSLAQIKACVDDLIKAGK